MPNRNTNTRKSERIAALLIKSKIVKKEEYMNMKERALTTLFLLLNIK